MNITIKYVNSPKQAGGKYGNLKLINGETIMVPLDLLGQFRSGLTCAIATKQQVWGQGTPDEKLVTIATTGPLEATTGAVQGQGVQAGYSSGVPRETSPRPNTGFQPRVIQGGAPQPQQPPDQARQIFVTGVVGRAMGSGKFAASEILVLTQAANEAFDRLRDDPPASDPNAPTQESS